MAAPVQSHSPFAGYSEEEQPLGGLATQATARAAGPKSRA